jgi:hypothetical protein
LAHLSKDGEVCEVEEVTALIGRRTGR